VQVRLSGSIRFDPFRSVFVGISLLEPEGVFVLAGALQHAA
jgi:hypothetical protein